MDEQLIELCLAAIKAHQEGDLVRRNLLAQEASRVRSSSLEGIRVRLEMLRVLVPPGAKGIETMLESLQKDLLVLMGDAPKPYSDTPRGGSSWSV